MGNILNHNHNHFYPQMKEVTIPIVDTLLKYDVGQIGLASGSASNCVHLPVLTVQ